MDLSNALTMDPEAAAAKATEYREVKMPTDEDRRLVAIFTALSSGKQVIDWQMAIRDGGLDEDGRPKLAIGRTKDQWCYLRTSKAWSSNRRSASFYYTPNIITGAKELVVDDMPDGLSEREYARQRSQVPIVPPACRVRGWKSMLVLWEVEEWAESPIPPGDPILLKPLLGALCTVEATWDLTDVERLVLGQRP